MEKIRLGVIGAGLIWKHVHKPILTTENRAHLAAFAAARVETLESLKLEFPGADLYSDYRELLNDPALDAVVILTPLTLNGTITLEALRKGKHVLVEKPLTTSAEEAAQIVEEERRSGKMVLVLEQARYSSRLQRMKSLLSSGAIGKVISYEIVEHGKLDAAAHNYGGYGQTAWRAEAQFPLGCLFDGGIHAVSDLTYLLGAPELVYARGSKIREGFGEYDHVMLMLSHQDGVNGMFSHSGYMDGRHNGIMIRGTEGTLRLYDGTITLTSEREETFAPEHDDAPRRMWTHCLDLLSGKPAFAYLSQDAFVDVALLDAAARSLRTGQPCAPENVPDANVAIK